MVSGSYQLFFESPIGWLKIRGDVDAVCTVSFAEEEQQNSVDLPAVLLTCGEQLRAYFDGKKRTFDVPIRTNGTHFQKQVWGLLAKIPFGNTVSYQYLARQLNNAGAVRAVGLANSKNPFAILLPCHRVIGVDGQLTGYAGGLWRKRWLLEHEMQGGQFTLF